MAEYINREELIENLNKFAHEHYNALINQLITKQPAADVVEVKHGYWANEDFPEKIATVNDFAICSICNNSSHKAEHGYSILSDCCPNCGAKMDGKPQKEG